MADELGDQIGDTRNPEPEDASQTFYMKGKVTALLATLKEKERKVRVGGFCEGVLFFGGGRGWAKLQWSCLAPGMEVVHAFLVL